MVAEIRKAKQVASYKLKIGQEYEGLFSRVESGVLIDYQGIPANKIRSFRDMLRKNRLQMEVVRNRIARRIFQDAGVDGLDETLRGPVAVVFGGNDEVAASRTVMDFIRKEKALALRGGILDGRALSQREVEDLSRLPTRKEMLAQLLAVFIAPATNVASLLNNTVAQFANLVTNHIDKLEKAAGENAPAPEA